MTIRFSLRSLAGPDCPWSLVRELAVVDVAQDELTAWGPPSEPQLLRITVTGEDDAHGAALVGDWLLAPSIPRPRRVPRARCQPRTRGGNAWPPTKRSTLRGPAAHAGRERGFGRPRGLGVQSTRRRRDPRRDPPEVSAWFEAPCEGPPSGHKIAGGPR